MRYLKTQLKVLIAIFLGLSLMALAGKPIQSSDTNKLVVSNSDQPN